MELNEPAKALSQIRRQGGVLGAIVVALLLIVGYVVKASLDAALGGQTAVLLELRKLNETTATAARAVELGRDQAVRQVLDALAETESRLSGRRRPRQ